MSVVLLTAAGPEHRYVARLLASRFSQLQIFAEEPRARPRSSFRRWSKRGLGCIADKGLRQVYRCLTRDAENRKRVLTRMLGDDGRFSLQEGHVRRVESVNADLVVEHLRRTSPRLVIVYGTGLVRSQVFEAVDCAVLNLHTGLSPWYRGVACHLWPLVDRRADLIGVTVHDCVAQLDAGGVLGTDVVPLQPGDTVHDVFARQVLVGAELLATLAVAEFQSPQPRNPQDLTLGREYRGVDLGIRAEISARRGLAELHRSRRVS